MTPADFAEARDRLGFTVRGLARFFQVNVTTAFDWARLGPPPAVAVALLLMLHARINARQAETLLGEYRMPAPAPERKSA